MRRSLVVVLCWAAGAAPLAAQGWGDSAATALAARAVAVRARSQGDSAVRAWQVDARGVLLFLARLGAESGPTRLVRADQLDVEVYWRAPGRSKQVIRGWRDRRYLPNELQYHRDHLGIVTDGFGPRIRLGEGDEVRDIVHPLSAEGLARYEFARRDSVRVSAAGRVVTMDVLDVRPRDPALPAVVGTLYLDRASAELVRFRFSFTPASYRDPSVEQITVRLENALVDGRAWLPYHQSIEIIRNAGALDLPYRGIIRGDWSFGDYTLEPALPDTVFRGVPIAGLRAPGDSAGPWPVPFDSVLASADPAVS